VQCVCFASFDLLKSETTIELRRATEEREEKRRSEKANKKIQIGRKQDRGKKGQTNITRAKTR